MSSQVINLRVTHASGNYLKFFLKGITILGTASLLGYGYQQYQQQNNNKKYPGKKLIVSSNLLALSQLFTLSEPPRGYKDYQEVYNSIAQKLQDEDEYDDGSYGPILVRLAWHQSGTYRKNPKYDSGCPYSGNVGGSFGGTMHYDYEAAEPGNNGLKTARDFLQEFKEKYPWLSYGDLYTLGGVTAVQELGGPKIGWRGGREELTAESQLPHGRLPDGGKGAEHIREVFGSDAMGFNDQEIVALIGAHCLGRCHVGSTGFDGPWTFSPTMFTNDFFKLLLNEKWHIRKWDGPKQWQDDNTNSLMMLPADYALIEDPKFKQWVVKYAEDDELFFKDFSKLFADLLELGIAFPANEKRFIFKTLDEQE